MIADFREFYQMKWGGLWRGEFDAEEAINLIAGLMARSASRFRAEFLVDNPPQSVEGRREAPSWMEWSPETTAVTALANTVISALGGGKTKRSDLFQFPWDAAQKQRFTTVADFYKAVKNLQ